MTPYVYNELPMADIRAFERATALVARIPRDFEPRDLRCHELARAIALFIRGAKVQDGQFGDQGTVIQHSWLRLESGSILDPYQPGTLPQCVLIDAYPGLPQFGLYREGEPRKDIDEEVVDRLRTLLEQPPAGPRTVEGYIRKEKDK